MSWTKPAWNKVRNSKGPLKGNHLNPTSCQSSDTSLVLESTTHSTSSPELTRHGTKHCAVNTQASQSDILHMIDQAAQSGSPKEMLECFNQLIHTENKVNQESLDQGLLLSCRYGREFLVHILIFHGANIETRDKDGNKPLLICAEKGFTDIALLLVDKGADINSYNKDGDTALLLSIQPSGSSHLIRRLLDKPELTMDHKNKNGCDALMKAIEVLNFPLMDILLKKQTDINACSNVSNSASKLVEHLGFESLMHYLVQETHDPKTALEKAVLMKDKYIIKLLLACGLVVFDDSNGEDKDNYIVFLFIKSILESKQEITEDDLYIIQILIKAGAPINSVCGNYSFDCILTLSIRIGCYNLVEMLCRHGADVNKQSYYSNKSPLIVAAEVGRCDIIDLLLDYGAKISQDSCQALPSAIVLEQIDSAKLLIKHGAKIDASEALTSTVMGNKLESFQLLIKEFKSDVHSQIRQIGTKLLNIAAKNGYKDMIKLLVEEGANVNGNYSNQTPLMSATDPSIMDFLIQLGADVNITIETRWNSYSALTFILTHCERGQANWVNILIKNGADVNVEDKEGNTLLIKASEKSGMKNVVHALLKAGADVNKQNEYCESALHVAIRAGSIEIVKVLLEFKADINLKDSTGQTPLFCVLSEKYMQLIELMLKNKANVNDVDNKGNTPLLHVCSSSFNDSVEVVRLLIKAGASVNHQNKEGYTPLMLAANGTQIKRIKLLCESGAEVNLVNEKKKETALSALIYCGVIQSIDTESVICLIENGADSSFLSPDVIYQLILIDEHDCLKHIISLGYGPKEVNQTYYDIDNLPKGSPFVVSLCCGSSSVARFLNDIWFLTQSDITRLAHNKQLRESLESYQFRECLKFLDEYLSQPMPLQKLSFVVVSSAVGDDGGTTGRKERVRKLPIPKILQDKLLFKHAVQVELAADPEPQEMPMMWRVSELNRQSRLI
ncbi:ankyrin repeat and KH domain-containing protein 1-like isoform X2 [Physella acuta]|nr:ankyrin repeat and KH domain-containing protein 1-like isoform X2 [Physella acuta]